MEKRREPLERRDREQRGGAWSVLGVWLKAADCLGRSWGGAQEGGLVQGCVQGVSWAGPAWWGRLRGVSGVDLGWFSLVDRAEWWTTVAVLAVARSVSASASAPLLHCALSSCTPAPEPLNPWPLGSAPLASAPCTPCPCAPAPCSSCSPCAGRCRSLPCPWKRR